MKFLLSNLLKDKAREYHLKRLYGISLKQYNDLLKSQGGVCWICRKAPKIGKSLCVEHNHKTRLIRGLCCTWCNRYLIGRHTDPVIIRRLAEYLEQDTGLLVPLKKKKRKKRSKK